MFARSLQLSSILRRTMCAATNTKYPTLLVTQPHDFVKVVEINRPEKANAMNSQFWTDIKACFTELNDDPDCRSVVLTAKGSVFTAGIDLVDFAGIMSSFDAEDAARKAFQIHKLVSKFQSSFSAIEKCKKPVVCAINGACVGGGVDLISATDIRMATEEAWFQIKEVQVGLAADVGTLQRFQKIVGNDSLTRQLAFTADKFSATDALKMGLLSEVFKTQEDMMKCVIGIAVDIASQSPVAVQTTKLSLNYSRSRPTEDGLTHVAALNSVMLQSDDLLKSVQALMSKQKGDFAKL